jgi:hypothetical protein
VEVATSKPIITYMSGCKGPVKKEPEDPEKGPEQHQEEGEKSKQQQQQEEEGGPVQQE